MVAVTAQTLAHPVRMLSLLGPLEPAPPQPPTASAFQAEMVQAGLAPRDEATTPDRSDAGRRNAALVRRRADRDRWLRVPVTLITTGDPRLALQLIVYAAVRINWTTRMVARFAPAETDPQRRARIADHDRRIEDLMRQKAGNK